MSQRTTLLSFIFIFSLFVIFNSDNLFEDKSEEPHEVSGAYHALNFFGIARLYPTGQLPENAHYAAWDKLQKQETIRKNGPETDWESMGPHNFSGRTLELAFNPLNYNTMYAGSASGGLWKTYSAGRGKEAWQRVNTGFPVLGVSSIALPKNDSMTIYIGTGEVYNVALAGTGAAYRNTRGSYGIGILKSTDGGNNWTKSLDWSYNQNHGVWDIKISYLNSNLIYAATTDGVYKSSDSGQSWKQVHQVVMSNSLLIHSENDNHIVVGSGNFDSPGAGIYKSTDAGESWIQITTNVPNNFYGKIQLTQAPSDPNIIYGSVGNGFSGSDGATWTLRSDDFGTSWEVISTVDYSRWQGWFAHDIDVSPHDPNSIIVGGIGLWQSEDLQESLRQSSQNGLGYESPPIEGPDGPGRYIHSDIHDVMYHPVNSEVFYVASDGGVHQTENNGITFHSRNGGLQTVQFYNGTSSSQLNSNLFIGGLQDNGTISYNGTKKWTRIFGGDGSWSAIDPFNNNNIIASSQFLNMVRSSDGGDTFKGIAPPSNNENATFIAPFVMSQNDPNILYAARSRVYKSTNRGDDWEATNGGQELDGLNPILSMAISSQNSNVVYAASAPTEIFGGRRGHAYVTKNGGEFWTQITGQLPDRFPMEMAVDPISESTAYIAFSGYGSGHVYKTTDFGETWKDISISLPDVPTNTIVIDPKLSNHVYIGNDLGVFVSEDGGETWSVFNNGLYEAVMVFDLTIASEIRKIRLVTHGNGAFERDLIEVPILIENVETLALEISPNPSNASVHVSYNISSEESHSAKLFDTSGQLIREFFNRTIFPGKYQLNFQVNDLPASTYFFQLGNESTSIVEQIVVVK